MITLGFLALGFISLIGAFLIEGGHAGSLVVDTAAMIVYGGTLAAVGTSFPFDLVKKIPTLFKKAMADGNESHLKLVFYFVDTASLVRREGILALEKNITQSAEEIDRLTKTGLQLVADGVEEHLLRDVLETYVENISERHKEGIAVMEAAGGFSPTMGIIGTVMGLVHVLSNLSEPEKLGPAISVAFIATLYGVATANLVWLPLATKLKALNMREVHHRTMVVEAIIMISQGLSHKIVEERLKAFLEPEELEKLESMAGH